MIRNGGGEQHADAVMLAGRPGEEMKGENHASKDR